MIRHRPSPTPPEATPDPLVAALREVLCAAVRAWRKSAPFGTALVAVVPDKLIDEIAARLAPIMRGLVREAVHAELDTEPQTAEAVQAR